MRAIAYIRVSTDRQEHSPKAQLERIQAYCTMHGHELVAVYQDAQTAKNLDRPQIQLALEAMAAGDAEVLVIAKLDRLMRSLRDLQDLVDISAAGGWTFASITEQFDTSTPMGRFVLNIIGAVAQMEREVIAERTRDVMCHLKSNGKRWTKDAPYGFVWESPGGELIVDTKGRATLTRDTTEFNILMSMMGMARAGVGPTKIAEAFNLRGWVNRAGRAWSRQRVHKILQQSKGALWLATDVA
jgi:site-specific DNA recombinase